MNHLPYVMPFLPFMYLLQLSEPSLNKQQSTILPSGVKAGDTRLMAPLESGSSQLFFNSNVIDNTFDIYECNSMGGTQVVKDHSRFSRRSCTNNVPDPPPLPGTSYGKQRTSRNAKACRIHVSEEVQDSWSKLFSEGYEADVSILTDDGTKILSHSCILVSDSFPVMAIPKTLGGFDLM
jgi:hypothetical protein